VWSTKQYLVQTETWLWKASRCRWPSGSKSTTMGTSGAHSKMENAKGRVYSSFRRKSSRTSANGWSPSCWRTSSL